MSTRTFRSFVAGSGVWRGVSTWHPILAILAAIGVVVVGQVVPILVIEAVTGGKIHTAPADYGPEAIYEMMQGSGAAILLLGQACLALLTIGVASLHGARFADTLSLNPPEGGRSDYLYAFVLMVPLLALANAAAYTLSPDGFMSDFQQFAGLARTDQPVAAFLAIAVGAPLWEEMLFRGFLLAPLVGPLGFWPAAVLVSGAWTSLHIGYSAAGLAEVFMIGLFFAWLLRQTGSLWIPITCHAAYNAVLFLALRYLTA